MYLKKLTGQVIRRPDYPVVETVSGRLRGTLREGVFRFLGIPYARAERFHMPKPVESWPDIRDAITYGYTSPEFGENIPQDEGICPHYFLKAGEDCQYLNVWTPSIDAGAGLPVVVWMHGGGWVSGSGMEQLAYDGENFAGSEQVVFVTFNSRQNCLGALDLSSMGQEYQDSVYAGLGDVLAAMKWIHDNIQAFGGAADNVTVIGQAGGGKRALALMQTPAADGLYQKMAIGSCAGERMAVPAGWTRKEIAQRMGELVAGQLGLGKDTITQIRQVPLWQLMQAAKDAQALIKKEVPDRFRWEPVADQVFFFDDPFAVGFREETNGIPMMMGSSFSEMMGNTRVKIGDGRKNQWSPAQAAEQIAGQLGRGWEQIAEAFGEAYPDHREADVLFVDRKIRPKLCELALKRAAAGNPVWNWVFHLESPVDGGLTAWHCSETPFILRNAEYIEAAYIPGITPRLQDQMAGAWAAFARTGTPQHGGIPQWPQVQGGRLPAMLFGETADVRVNHDLRLRELFGEEERQ